MPRAEQNHYKVLSLSPLLEDDRTISRDQLKVAYRQALLQSHPDKSNAAKASSPSKAKYTIDEIAEAFKVLSDPLSRSAFDRKLRLQHSQAPETVTKPLTGLETVDLDDLYYNEEQSIWYRPCHCGNTRGYLISEEDLEKEVEHGEIIAGCGGCSLWLRVVFQQAEV